MAFKLRKALPAILFIITVVTLPACKKSNPSPQSPAGTAITSLSVDHGPFNTVVVINGTGFSSNAPNDVVMFNGKAAEVSAASSTQLTVKVPVGAGTGPVTVSVSGAAAATGPTFTYITTTTVTTLTTKDGNKASFGNADVWGVAVDAQGNVYATVVSGVLQKLTAEGVLQAFAGKDNARGNIDGIGTSARFQSPYGMQMGADGNLYVSDRNVIRQITPAGAVSSTGFKSGGDYLDVAVDVAGNKYVADGGNNRILKIDAAGAVTTFAGNGVKASIDGKGTSASFNLPDGIAIDGKGNIYVADGGSSTIRKITADGTVTTIAGTGTAGYKDGNGKQASFSDPAGIAIDATGNLYIADFANSVIRKITTDGTVSTYAGNGQPGNTDGPALSATLNSPQGLTFDAKGNLYVGDGIRVRKIIQL